MAINIAYFRFFTKPSVNLGFNTSNIHQYRVWSIPGKLYGILFKYFIAPPIDVLSGARGDVYLFPNFARWPLFFRSRSIVVIHDLAYLNAPQYVPPRLRAYLNKFVPRAISNSQMVLAVSETTKQDLITSYGIDPAKIMVASNAVDHSIFYPRKKSDIHGAKQDYGIEGKYIMFTGTIEPRKNIQGVLRAYQALPDKMRNEYSLVLTGGKGWMDGEITDLITSLRQTGTKVIQTGYVALKDLPALYSGASIFVYPSFYEGFGLPVIEAMACGVPVITSNISSLPEAAGGAGILVDPTNDQAIADAIEIVLADPKRAAAMSAKGIKHSKKFDWAISAAHALEAIMAVRDSR